MGVSCELREQAQIRWIGSVLHALRKLRMAPGIPKERAKNREVLHGFLSAVKEPVCELQISWVILYAFPECVNLLYLLRACGFWRLFFYH